MSSLTPGLKLYFHYLAYGLSDRAIAHEMSIHVGTIHGNYRMRALTLTGLASKEELVHYAKENGYADLDPLTILLG